MSPDAILFFKHHEHSAAVVNRGQRIVEDGQRFHEQMEGFANGKLFPQKPVHAHNEPDPSRMFFEIVPEDARDVSSRRHIIVEIFLMVFLLSD